MAGERRRFSRHPASIPVQCLHRGQVETLLTDDVSRHGAFVLTDNPRSVGELLQLTFHLPGGRRVQSLCVIRRSLTGEEPGGPGVGVDFFALEQEDKTAWDDFVDEVEAKALRPAPAGVPPATPEAGQRRATREAISISIHDPPSSPEPYDDTPFPVPAEHARRQTEVRATACFIVRLKDEDALREFHARDVTTGETFIRTPVLRDTGDLVEVVLVHPLSDEEYRLRGAVTHVVENPDGDHGLTIRFLPVGDDDTVALLTFIETGSDHLSPAPDTGVDAVQRLERACEENPENPHAHLQLGFHLLEERRDPKAAVASFLRALEVDPALPEAHRRLHRAYVRLKDARRAAAHLRVALALETVGYDAITEEGVRL